MMMHLPGYPWCSTTCSWCLFQSTTGTQQRKNMDKLVKNSNIRILVVWWMNSTTSLFLFITWYCVQMLTHHFTLPSNPPFRTRPCDFLKHTRGSEHVLGRSPAQQRPGPSAPTRPEAPVPICLLKTAGRTHTQHDLKDIHKRRHKLCVSCISFTPLFHRSIIAASL